MSGQEFDRAGAVVRTLREAARRGGEGCELSAGFTDAEMDGWDVPVPPEVRAVLREIGGMRLAGSPGVTHSFGPHRHLEVLDGFWHLGDMETGEGSLLVGARAAGWGPVVSADQWSDVCEVTVEAPDFLGWLTDRAERLVSGVPGRPGPKASVEAVASIEVAGGADAELAGLVGEGDPLTDLVDLRALPGYPCRVNWEPYFSTADDTPGTGNSLVHYRLAGDGRAMLLHSEVTGDFLSRPVRRHAVPADAAARAMAELRSLAQEFPGYVTIAPGCDDTEMDGWPVAVPEDVRRVLRETGGVTVEGMPGLRMRPREAGAGVDPDVHRMLGGDGTYWPLAEVHGQSVSTLVQIRLDPETGEWGYAVSVPADVPSLREYPEVTLLAESLPALLLEYARRARRATAEPGFAGRAADGGAWLFCNTGNPWPRPVEVTEWNGSADPLLAEAAGLPPGSRAADLRTAPVPGDLCFYRDNDWPYPDEVDRLHFLGGGRVVAAVPAGR